MFQVGQLVVYGSTGVCTIREIRENPGDKRCYYVLKPLYQSCTISAPADSSKIFIRPILTRQEATALIDKLPAVSAEPCQNRSIQQLTEHYKAALESHNCMTIAELAKSIYVKKQNAALQNRKLGSVDERFMKRAEELLFGELAAALDIPPESVPGYIEARLKSEA